MNRGRTTNARRVPGATFINTTLAALVLPIWLLTLLAWAVQLAGMAAVQRAQGRRYLQFDWFITSLELVVLLLMFFNLLARRSTPGIIALKAVVTVLEILRTNVWNNARLGRGLAGTNFTQVDSITNPGLNASTARVNLLFSGYLITAALNCLLILAMGSLPSYSAQDNEYMSKKGTEFAESHDRDRNVGTTGPNVHSGVNGSGYNNPNSNGAAPSGATTGANQAKDMRVPPTNLHETRNNDGLAGPTYVQGASNRV